MAQRRILIGADQGGFALKEVLKKHLSPRFQVEDVGTHEAGKPADYPDIAVELSNRLLKGPNKSEYQGGILLCGSGIGISIAANKIPGIRCALCHDYFSARMARQHCDANVIAIGGSCTGDEVAKELVDCWLGLDFDGGVWADRLTKINSIEIEASK